MDVDVVLLQESKRPPFAGVVGNTIKGSRPWGSWIVPFGQVRAEEIPAVELGDKGPKDSLEASHPGAYAAADLILSGGGSVTAVSLYGLLGNPARNGMRYAVTTVHRSLSDLTPILDVKRSKAAAVLGGDLNVSPQIKEPDTAAHVAVIQRIEAFGLRDCLGETHEDYVRTFGGRDADDAQGFQDDWIFASRPLTLLSCETIDTVEAWEVSDHCPVVAEFEV